MKRNRVVALATASLVGAAVLPLTAGSVGAAPATAPAPEVVQSDSTARSDDLPAPAWKQKYDAIRQAAIEKRLRTGGSGDAERLSKGVYGRVATTGTEKIFVVLAEFGNTTHSAFPDGEGNATTFDGPRRNQIPKPNRKTDNSTNWRKNYGRNHYKRMYFRRMSGFYERESNGTYSVDGTVTEWVKVPFNQARYGRDDCPSVACDNTWFLIRDSLAYWVEKKKDDGWSMRRISRYLKTFDRVDRYDFDGDGNFNEPDGYIDHFQVVHAGRDAADGDPIYGDDAIWSHRWNAQIEPAGTGPLGGAQIGGVNAGMGGLSDGGGAAVRVPDNPTGVWVNDYTIQPENGGLGVFAHEYAHDLGLPDLYDTSGNQGGAENSVGFWSLMSQSRGTRPQDDGVGDRASPMGAWDKFQLGWLDYELAATGFNSTHRIRPSQSSDASPLAEAVVVLLPDKEVVSELGAPCAECGEKYYYSDQGNNLDNTMTRDVAGGGELTAQVRYEIEDGYDYALLEASGDGGDTWAGVQTSEQYEGGDGSGLDPDDVGISGNTGGEWVNLTATVPDGTDALRWRYVTDPSEQLPGFQVDNVVLAGEAIGTAEADDEAWTLDGFLTTTGTEVDTFLNAYFVDNRQYVGVDQILKHLYDFAGYRNRPLWVDWFKNNQGALISYWDTSYTDNNVGDHPGGGQILPVDSHPEIDHAVDGSLLRPRIATRDSTFSLSSTPKAELHYNGAPYRLPRQGGVALFDDMEDWWYGADGHSSSGGGHPGRYQPGWYSVDVPKTGTTVRVVRVNRAGVMTVRIGSSN